MLHVFYGILATLGLLALIRTLLLAANLTVIIKSLHDHYIPTDLTRKTIGHMITDLENGGTMDKYNLEEALMILTNHLTDMLLGNNYDLRRWNPKILLYAILGSGPLLNRLKHAIAQAAEKKGGSDDAELPIPD